MAKENQKSEIRKQNKESSKSECVEAESGKKSPERLVAGLLRATPFRQFVQLSPRILISNF